ncbi:hypothetical protein [Methanoculleus taiwanensis]|uniref:hypothetical protein n=1 Tax=Methanoculleus taiwanensis TaxID=1550565 RepID=UPI000FFF350C|nr:hypothetical protein [Methanoculleus taiwanensis]
MAKNCEKCGARLSFFQGISGRNLCDQCNNIEKAEREKVEAERKVEFNTVKSDIISSKVVQADQIEFLKTFGKKELLSLFNEVFEDFESDGELDKGEIESLVKIKSDLGLDDKETRFEERIRPYVYVYCIKNENSLPVVDLPPINGSNIVLKKGETVHFATSAILKEMKTVSLGYRGGSQGVSFRVMKGVSYRVGSHRGHIVKEDRLTETSRGALILTNKRIILHPAQGRKAVSIQLPKIISYNCYENGLEVHKDGREKGFFFETFDSGSSEVIGICLGFLFENAE